MTDTTQASVHQTAFGSHLPRGLTVDLQGYIPLPGADVRSFAWEDDEWIETMAEGEDWNGESWAGILERNDMLCDEAQESLRKRNEDDNWATCARCGNDTEGDVVRNYEDGGTGQCACGLELPDPSEGWLVDNGYEDET